MTVRIASDAAVPSTWRTSDDTGRRRWLLAVAASSVGAFVPWAGAQTVDEFSANVLKGAGSTFVHPLMDAWAREYRRVRAGSIGGIRVAGGGLDDDVGGVALDYESIGSQAGIQRLLTRSVDFAASEMPLRQADLDRHGLEQVPMVVGALAVVVNLGEGVTNVRLDAATLADIYLGRITNWSDPALRALNAQAALPDLAIDVVRRLDGSGTTFAFTSWLSHVSKTWDERVGADVAVAWPVGRGARGNSGVARAVRDTRGAIGYVSAAQAAQSGLVAAQLRNAAGRFVVPGAEGVRSAMAAAGWEQTDRRDAWLEPLVHTPGDASYPIVATVYALVGRQVTRRSRMARAFVAWALAQGHDVATRQGYVPLASALAEKLVDRLRPS